MRPTRSSAPFQGTRQRLGGAQGNALLTSLLAAVLLVLLAVEGATIPLAAPWLHGLER